MSRRASSALRRPASAVSTHAAAHSRLAIRDVPSESKRTSATTGSVPRFAERPRLAATVSLFTRYGLKDFARQQGLLELSADEANALGDALKGAAG